MPGATRKVSDETAEEMILQILKDSGPLTTIEIEERFRKHNTECPDSAALFLNKMRQGGKIKGELSMEHKGWLWRVD